MPLLNRVKMFRLLIIRFLLDLQELQSNPEAKYDFNGEKSCIKKVFLRGKIFNDSIGFFHYMSSLTRFHFNPLVTILRSVLASFRRKLRVNYKDERKKIKPKVDGSAFFGWFVNGASEWMVAMQRKQISIPSDVRVLLDKIRHAGFDVWVVGGAVRDYLLGVPARDWDLATNALPGDVISLFQRVIPVGIRHGTVQVLTEERSVEVTSYAGRGHEGILAELGRRDFTVNAIALAYPTLELIDPFGGREDVAAGLLRGVGDATDRFREDPIRTLRAGRFVSVYGFSLETRTFDALKNAVEGLKTVAIERIREEMFKLLVGDSFLEAFEWMRRAGVIGIILPEIAQGPPHHAKAAAHQRTCEHLLRSVQFAPKRVRLRLAALFHDIAVLVQPELLNAGSLRDEASLSARIAAQVLMRWRAPKKMALQVSKLVESHIPTHRHAWSDAQIRHWLAKLGIGLTTDLLDLAYADRLSKGVPSDSLQEIELLRRRVHSQMKADAALQIRDLVVNGHDLIGELNLAPGPVVGKILRELHKVVLNEPTLNDRLILLDHARELMRNDEFQGG